MGISASEYLLRDLKRKRLKAGLTQAQLGERIHYSDTHVSGIETGSKPVTFAYLRLVDEALGLDDHFQVMWEELVKDSDAPVWLREWMVLEREATALRWYEHAFVPGLLQTEAYMRAIFSASHRLQANDIEQQVASRLERQKILTGDTAPNLFVVVDAMVLKRQAGQGKVMAEQMAHLLACAEQPKMHLQVIPTSLGMYSGLAGAFILADLPDAHRAGYVDNQLTAQIVERPDDIATLTLSWDAVRDEALPRSQTLDLLKEAAQSWT
ncbi:helix-turn-helix domain-containing protein [Micromonospora sp. NBC_01796]|uniref:helix-turn-helix domain-containing protein n=1 Tax=Micromonospora sp. NBC_01796 TaxID=2975987 RepID=UPI002DDB6E6C|nr:helix-turn-helix transcriptional regulator [Micromonospora sp. NBC_01796]WSA89455.1 helix-turn-helix transcriptional regulator [Micromonospora sp. NBC_01796]